MNLPALRPPRPGVLSRGRFLLVVLAAALAAAPAGVASPGGGKEREPAPRDGKAAPADADGEPAPADEPPPKPKKTAEQRVLEALGAAWKSGDIEAIADRLPKKRKIALHLSEHADGDYRREQARSLIDAHFAGRTCTSVELDVVRETVGTFDVVAVRRRDHKRLEGVLVLTLGREKKRLVLVGVREDL